MNVYPELFFRTNEHIDNSANIYPIRYPTISYATYSPNRKMLIPLIFYGSEHH